MAGDRLYGRGVIDDKGPAIASIFAMKELLASDQPLSKRIRIIFGQTEENGEWTDMESYGQQEELPSYGFTPDGDFPGDLWGKGYHAGDCRYGQKRPADSLPSKAAALPTWCRTAARALWMVKVLRQRGKSSHGSAPWTGDNAITKMMERLCNDGFDVPFARMYMDKIGRCFHGEKMHCAFEDEESGKLSMNAGMIKEQDDQVILYLDIRYPVTYQWEEIMTVIEEEFAPYGVETRLIHRQDPVYMDKNGPVMGRLLEAYRSVTGDLSEPLSSAAEPTPVPWTISLPLAPNIPGHPNTEHEKNEYILIDDLKTIEEVYKRALEALAYEQIL